MQYQELPRIDSTALDGWGRWLIPALVGGVGLTAAVLLLLIGQPLAAGVALLAAGLAAAVTLWRKAAAPTVEPLVVGPDYSVVGAVLGLCNEPAALTTGEGSLLIANTVYRERFEGARPPLELGSGKDAKQALAMVR